MLIMEGGDNSGQQSWCIEHRPTEHTRVDSMFEDLDFHRAVHEPPKACGQCRDTDFPVAGIGNHDDVRAEQLTMRFEEGPESGGTSLLLALKEESDSQSELIRQNA
jgi:hypothetical protein